MVDQKTCFENNKVLDKDNPNSIQWSNYERNRGSKLKIKPNQPNVCVHTQTFCRLVLKF